MRSFLGNLFKILFVSICVVLTISIILLTLTGGDIFLTYLGHQLGLNISYENHVGFVSCFLLRSIVLKNPVFGVKESDLSIACKGAYIRPDFKHVLVNGGIILTCDLIDPVFLEKGEKVNLFFSTLISTAVPDIPAIDEIVSFVKHKDISTYERLLCDFELLKGEIRIDYFQLFSSDIKVLFSGVFLKGNRRDIKLKMYFSPALVASMPDALKDILIKEGSGWKGFSLDWTGTMDKPSLRIESQRFKLKFGEIDEK